MAVLSPVLGTHVECHDEPAVVRQVIEDILLESADHALVEQLGVQVAEFAPVDSPRPPPISGDHRAVNVEEVSDSPELGQHAQDVERAAQLSRVVRERGAGRSDDRVPLRDRPRNRLRALTPTSLERLLPMDLVHHQSADAMLDKRVGPVGHHAVPDHDHVGVGEAGGLLAGWELEGELRSELGELSRRVRPQPRGHDPHHWPDVGLDAGHRHTQHDGGLPGAHIRCQKTSGTGEGQSLLDVPVLEVPQGESQFTGLQRWAGVRVRRRVTDVGQVSHEPTHRRPTFSAHTGPIPAETLSQPVVVPSDSRGRRQIEQVPVR